MSRPNSFLPAQLQSRNYTLPIGAELRSSVARRLAAYERRLERFERERRGETVAAAAKSAADDEEDPSDTDEDDDFGALPPPAASPAAVGARSSASGGNFAVPRQAKLMQRAPQPPADLFMEVSLRMINIMRGDPFQRFIHSDLFNEYLARKYPAESEPEPEAKQACCCTVM